MSRLTVLHVSPHPDDELIGAPAALMALRDAGWRVVNLGCSLGPAGEADRRRQELTEACRLAGFDLEIPTRLLGDPLGPAELDAARAMTGEVVAEALSRWEPELVVAPSPHDRHPGHEVVGRGTLDAARRMAEGAPEPGDASGVPRLWLWGLWADLPLPTLAVEFDRGRMEEILAALGAHAGELARNDYRRLVRGRAEMNASLGPERVFGFGSAAGGAEYVEVLSELHLIEGRYRLGLPRWLDPGSPLAGEAGPDVTDWLEGASITTTFGPPATSS